ncbi:hypothetical protein [uncultured Desulfobacter sp.]|uniref:hypothetical protein n=1 Tax=uncultured Desulfobacter sp. TaxID=240139 RepID=UPI00374857E5
MKTANQVADSTEGVIRISIDTKANVKVGPFSRGGYSRQKVKACDHDYNLHFAWIKNNFCIILKMHC